jgi:phage tail sheath gpL-like
MPLSPPAGYSASTKRPGVRVAVRLGAGARSAGSGARRIILLANKLATGTKPTATPFFVPSLDDIRVYAGAGGEAFLGTAAVFGQYSQPNLWCCLVAENGSAVAATATLLFATNPTVAGVVRVSIAGYPIEEVTLSTTDTPTTTASKVSAAINAKTDWPVTASPTTGTVTITAKQKGPRGNLISVRAELTTASMTVALNGGAGALSVSGRMGTGSATAGSGADDFQAALDAIAVTKNDRIVLAAADSTNWGKLKIHLNAGADIMEGRRQQGIVATLDDLGTATTAAVTLNEPRMQVGWHYNADDLPVEIAAALAAARLYGDGDLKGEESYIAANLDTVQLRRIRVQPVVADRPLGTESESALNNGLTPLIETAANPGYVAIERSITTRSNDSFGNDNFAVLDTSKVSVSDFVADDLQVQIQTEYRGKNLTPDPADGKGPENSDVIYPSMVKGSIGKNLTEYQRRGLIERVAENMAGVLVEISPDNPALLIGEVPADVIEGFHNAALTVVQKG